MSMPKRWSYDHSDVTNEFSFHPADEVTGAVHNAVREDTAALAHRFVELLPEGDAKKQAIGKLREAMMWANAAVATQHDPIWRAEVAQLTITDEHGNVRYPRVVLEQPPQDQAQVAELVFQALGAASVAWIMRGYDGADDVRGPRALGSLEFDADLARTIGNDLMVALGYRASGGYWQEGHATNVMAETILAKAKSLPEDMAARLPQDLAAMAAAAALIDAPEAPVSTEPGCTHPDCVLRHPHPGPAILDITKVQVSDLPLAGLADVDAANVEAAPETQAALKRAAIEAEEERRTGFASRAPGRHPGPGGSL